MKEQIYQYGKYAAAGVVGIGVGVTGYAVTDTPANQTDAYQNLQEDLTQAQNNADNFEDQVESLQTTVTDKEEKVSNLESQVTQFQETVEQLRAENADLEEAVAQAQERVGLVDYLPVFSDSDVEFDGDIAVTVDAAADEGDYDQLDANYVSDDGQYDVTVTQYEESVDAEDAVEDFRETQTPVEFTEDGDTHTVTLNGYTGQFNKIEFDYDDADAIEDVDHEDNIEAVTVDGEDITDRVESVEFNDNGKGLRVVLDNGYYVNEGESVTVSFNNANSEGALVDVQVYNGSDWSDRYDYDQDDDTVEDIYRDGNTVVVLEGTDNGDEFEAQYADLTSQYE